MEFNDHLNNKKALYLNMKNFYENNTSLSVFDTLPVTFHIKQGTKDDEYNQFVEYFSKAGSSQLEG